MPFSQRLQIGLLGSLMRKGCFEASTSLLREAADAVADRVPGPGAADGPADAYACPSRPGLALPEIRICRGVSS